MMLTQLKITSAKPAAKPYNLADGQGLVLVVQPTGSKLWRFRHRYCGVQKTLHLGPWPALSLADAREKFREARKAIAAGIDPVLEKKRSRIAAKFAVATTFKDVSVEWIAKCEREGLHGVIAAGIADGTFAVAAGDMTASKTLSVSAWAIVHGTTLLLIDGIIQRDQGAELVENQPDHVVDLFAAGLRAGQKD